LDDESILGFLDNMKNLSEGMVFIGAIQRVVMGDLGFLLLELERWIYNNLKVTILNKYKSVIPPYIPYLNSKQREEYEMIWNAQGYNYYGPPSEVKESIKVDQQIFLVIDFLGLLDKWQRSLIVIGKDGKEFRFPVKRIQEKFKKRLNDIGFVFDKNE